MADEIPQEYYGTGVTSEVGVSVPEPPDVSVKVLTRRLCSTEDILTDEYIPLHLFPPSTHLILAVGGKESDGRENQDQRQCYRPLATRKVREG